MIKNKISKKNLKDWNFFTKNISKIDIEDKDIKNEKYKKEENKLKVIDLHGYSLDNANTKILEIINTSEVHNYNRIKVITGKGSRSNVENNPYKSSNLSILKNSIPNFLKNHEISIKISRIEAAGKNDGGEGAFYIFLK